jgi:hypothetical protein
MEYGCFFLFLSDIVAFLPYLLSFLCIYFLTDTSFRHEVSQYKVVYYSLSPLQYSLPFPPLSPFIFLGVRALQAVAELTT